MSLIQNAKDTTDEIILTESKYRVKIIINDAIEELKYQRHSKIEIKEFIAELEFQLLSINEDLSNRQTLANREKALEMLAQLKNA